MTNQTSKLPKVVNIDEWKRSQAEKRPYSEPVNTTLEVMNLLTRGTTITKLFQTNKFDL
jgi:hypothetical protein